MIAVAKARVDDVTVQVTFTAASEDEADAVEASLEAALVRAQRRRPGGRPGRPSEEDGA